MINQSVIDHLDDLQQKQNDGRGVSCIRSVIHYLRNNNYLSARTCYFNERDKTWQYPELSKFLISLFGENP